MSRSSAAAFGAWRAILAVAAVGAHFSSSFPAPRPGRSRAKTAAAPAVSVSVAVVEPKQTVAWSEFSGRLEAVERVDVRSRVAGAVLAVHFREGALVKQGDLLMTIDPDALPPPRSSGCRRRSRRPKRASSSPRGEVDRGQPLLDTRHRLAARRRPAHQCPPRGGRQPAGGPRGAAGGPAQPGLHRDACAGGGPRRAPGDHGRQPGGRRPRRPGADHARIDRSDLCQLQRRRGGGDCARCSSLGRTGRTAARSSKSPC